jgi:hypothetical protein
MRELAKVLATKKEDIYPEIFSLLYPCIIVLFHFLQLMEESPIKSHMTYDSQDIFQQLDFVILIGS